MGKGGLLVSETMLQTKLFFRSAVAAFFTLFMPLMFLIMINFFIPSDEASGFSTAQYFTPAIAVFGMVTATFTNLAINTSMARDGGILKRVAGTPLPMWVHLGGRIASAALVGLISVTLMLAVGWLLFDLEIPWSRMPLFALVILVGAAAFSALGLAVAAVTPNARAAPAIANFVILPLAFISGIFFPLDGSPEWLQTLASWLPLEPLASAAIALFDPSTPVEFPWGAIAKVLAWGAIGLAIALRFFSYEPAGTKPRGGEVSVAYGD